MQRLLLLLVVLVVVLVAGLSAKPSYGEPKRCFFFCGNGENGGQFGRAASAGTGPDRFSRMEDLRDYDYGGANSYGSRTWRPAHQSQVEIEHRPQDLEGMLFFSQTSSSSSTNSNTATQGYMRYPIPGKSSRQYAPMRRYSSPPCLDEFNEYVEPCRV
jgi:hypothetical protein